MTVASSPARTYICRLECYTEGETGSHMQERQLRDATQEAASYARACSFSAADRGGHASYGSLASGVASQVVSSTCPL